ncbi:MAG: KR domain-containing protein, partial [Polyangiaceae bacterium]|nr:KR domain-containing protein [Polyangiaceae bacterium]
RWLAEQRVGKLVLLGRRGLETPGAQREIEAIRARGVPVDIAGVDVSDEPAMRRILESIDQGPQPLAAVIHAAGLLNDAALGDLTEGHLSRVLSPKSGGAWVLHRLLQDRPRCGLVLFSSIASVLGSVGQANYAAANAVLDAIAHHRRAAGLPTWSINWGPWSGPGMGESMRAGPLASTLHALDPDAALRAMALAMARDLPQIMIADIDWPRFRPLFEAGRPRPMLAPLAADVRVDPELEAFRRRIEEAAPPDRVGLIEERLCTDVRRVLGLREGQPLDAAADLFDLGLDSLMVLELRNSLTVLTGRSIEVGVIYQHPSVAALASAVAALASAPSGEAPPVLLPAPLVALRPDGDRSPLFCVHAGTGGVEVFTGVAARLRARRPFIGVQAWGIRPGEEVRTSFVDMAASYLDAIRRVQPAGPYLLGGYSLGGVLAFEMASQLEARGETVERLVLIDSWPHHRVRKGAERRRGEELLIFAASLGCDVKLHPDDARISEDEAWARVEEAFGRQSMRFDRSDLERRRAVGDGLAAAWEIYASDSVLRAPITLIRATHAKGIPGVTEEQVAHLMATSRDYGWSDRTEAAVIVEQVGGDHFSMIREPHVLDLAAAVERAIK